MLADDATEFFWKNGFCSLGRILSREQAWEIRLHVERFETDHRQAIGKLDLKANLLFTWCDKLSSHPAVMPRLRHCWAQTFCVTPRPFETKPPTGVPTLAGIKTHPTNRWIPARSSPGTR